ncbi:hypothetical protein BGW38_006220 [Lunasporangiospora selenospora]|uniref:VWFA domain-containing protein n=1 Tax=Lunasporangiospora selenospora TaxID=979761 RepID=A0A9P6KH43_9FUNG|nr:hypothetical protein BGW38_006220 [Lunasporangiospora selenospora]
MFFKQKHSPPNPNSTPGSSSGTGSIITIQSSESSSSSDDQDYQALKATYLAEFVFNGIQVSATPLLPSVLRGLQTELPILLEIKVGQRSNTDKGKDPAQTPFNVCLVLDTSLSMNGPRLRGCKKAINAIIQQLTQYDTLSLVTYSSAVKTIFVDCDHTHKNLMLDLVDKIKPEGMTDLCEGLKVGVESLKRSIGKENSVQDQGESNIKRKKLHRVFLFSDGLVNHGVTSPEHIMARTKDWLDGTDISISTFGIGDGYDEKLMTAIAQHADGEPFYIETEVDIEEIVSKGLRGVSNMVAPAATLKIRGLGDAVVKDIPGYDMTKTPGQITVRNLRVNGLIQLIVNLDIRVPGLNDFSEDDMVDVEDPRKVLGYSLTFEGDKHSVDLEECKDLRSTVSVNYTTDSSLVSEDKKNRDVVAYLAIKEAAKIEKEVMEHLANNRTAEALSAKKKAVSMYKAAASKDRRGFARAMQTQSERLVNILETSGNTNFAQKVSAQQQYQSSRHDVGYSVYE